MHVGQAQVEAGWPHTNVHGICLLQNVASWEEAKYEGGPAPAPRKGAAMASTAGRFAVMFGGKATADDGTETCFDETLVMEALGGSILRIHTLAVGPTKPAPRAGAMFQVLLHPISSVPRMQAHSSAPILIKGMCLGAFLQNDLTGVLF